MDKDMHMCKTSEHIMERLHYDEQSNSTHLNRFSLALPNIDKRNCKTNIFREVVNNDSMIL